jgi:hypothetical protein
LKLKSYSDFADISTIMVYYKAVAVVISMTTRKKLAVFIGRRKRVSYGDGRCLWELLHEPEKGCPMYALNRCGKIADWLIRKTAEAWCFGSFFTGFTKRRSG